MRKVFCMILTGVLLFMGTACKKEDPNQIREEDVEAFLRGENEALIDKLQSHAE